MANLNYEELIDLYIPNFRRFEVALDAESNIIVDIAILLKKVYNADLLESLGKYINLELGMCILKDSEIDREKLKEMMSTFRK